MRYYPIFLDISGRCCTVIGGGDVAARKAKTLIECGASVTVVSPEITESLHALADQKKITWKNRTCEARDVTGAFLVFGATNDNALNRRIQADAKEAGALCNIVDQPELCDFILPSLVERGDLVIAVSTTGKSPAYARKLKKYLEKRLGDEHRLFLELMGAIRKKLLNENRASHHNKPLFEKLVDAGLIEMIKNRDDHAINETLGKILGPGYDYDSLMSS
ncbi:MAG: bifunctional precorrin-2 dehydrogenase/sirohydrochlorin ferrochelatase [Desulfobacterales bacterium]